jgi:hypothetical protein
VQVSYDEGVAIHIGPESCAVAREGFGEALTGGRIGQPSSRERVLFWVPTPCKWRHVQTLLAREPGDLAIDRSATAVGPHREGEERAARLAAILVGESPTSIGVQSML